MIGNDIVDLKMAHVSSRWDSHRFIEKVFSNYEQEFIGKANDAFKTIWILWSMKESAYKSYVRRYSKCFFSPRKLECRLDSTREGTVTIGYEKYITSSVVNDHYIYTTAHENESRIQKEFQSKCFLIDQVSYSKQHAACYDKVVQDLSGLYQTHNHCFSIRKNNEGVPTIYNNDIKLPILLSITHHGLFGAYAYVKL